jgi:hypothetical protein
MEGMDWFSSILLCLWNLSIQQSICSKFDGRRVLYFRQQQPKSGVG